MFHIAWLIIMLVTTLVGTSSVKADRNNDKRYFFGKLNKIDFTVFQFGILLLSIELYKQLVFLDLREGLAEYDWYGFPLQFCSIPLFLYPVVPFIKNEKIKEAFYAFIAIFNLIAGLSVMVLGVGVFTNEVSISVHTMIWHGSMVVVAIYLISAYKIGTKWQHFLSAVAVLFGLIVFVQLMNVLFHYIGETFPGPQDFDGFFISPWIDRRNMPVLGDIRGFMIEANFPTFVIAVLFPLIYFIVFSFGGLLVYYILHFMWNYMQKLNNKKNKQIKGYHEVKV